MSLRFTRLLFLLLFLGAISFQLKAQLLYTQPVYPIDTVNDILYGGDTTFSGNYESLTYDLYRPVGDSNCRRPVAVVIHGGAWVAGTNRDPNVVYFAQELARRGWMVVAPTYRMGNHKITSYTMYALCNASLADPCAYAHDSAEVIRANYRAMQDMKGLLRFLSGRASQDSTDMDNLFLIGESAGGFIAMTTAFLDQPSEKPAVAGSLGNVP
ncbi:MAG: alpha/beta hydrolase, partial [Flavobacteriales bacterium]